MWATVGVFAAIFLALNVQCSPVPVNSRSKAVKHLRQYGYAKGNPNGRTGLTDSELAGAIGAYQKFFSLPITGILDSQTQIQMEKPRCQLSDSQDSDPAFENYVIYKNKWNGKITWRMNTSHPSVPASAARNIMLRSVQEWEKWMVTANLTESTDPNAIIIVNYPVVDASGNHGDPGNVFDNKTLAHAFYPTNHTLGGDIHFNTRFNFSLTEPPPSNEYSLIDVSVHELGHALGLRHTNVKGAVMYPITPAGYAYQGLFQDDILGIQAIYGPCNQQPCLNGGNCTHTASSPPYNCTCLAGYTGTHCELVKQIVHSGSSSVSTWWAVMAYLFIWLTGMSIY